MLKFFVLFSLVSGFYLQGNAQSDCQPKMSECKNRNKKIAEKIDEYGKIYTTEELKAYLSTCPKVESVSEITQAVNKRIEDTQFCLDATQCCSDSKDGKEPAGCSGHQNIKKVATARRSIAQKSLTIISETQQECAQKKK